MLHSLHIKNYILIDSLDVTFPAGLIIITGQTGAGKSILLGALQLVMGARADLNMVGPNGDTCVVEANFNIAGLDKCRQILKDNDLDIYDVISIRRVINSKGRSRSFVNDEPVSLSVLSSITYALLDIHSQNEGYILTDRDFQLSLVDFLANDIKQEKSHNILLGEYKTLWSDYQSNLKQLDNLIQREKTLNLEKEYNQSLLDRLEKANLKDDNELVELEEEQKKLSNAELIKSNLSLILSDLTNDEGESDYLTSLKEAIKTLQKLQNFIPKCEELATRLESLRFELIDIIDEVKAQDDDVYLSPERLEFVDNRLSAIYNLLKLHNVNAVSELISIKSSLEDKLESCLNIDSEIEELKTLTNNQYTELCNLADQLSVGRKKAAEILSKLVVDGLQFLELEKSRFEVSISPSVDLNSDGRDKIEFLFSSTGKNLINVAKCASGGEKSRILLVLKDIMGRYANMPTMIFDEIDTGVSGSVADKMGQMICRMSENMQVFAITHLPQVAAKGKAHYVISKSIQDNGVAQSTITEVVDNDRILEVARMLSGSKITPISIENAKELLGIK